MFCFSLPFQREKPLSPTSVRPYCVYKLSSSSSSSSGRFSPFHADARFPFEGVFRAPIRETSLEALATATPRSKDTKNGNRNNRSGSPPLSPRQVYRGERKSTSQRKKQVPRLGAWQTVVRASSWLPATRFLQIVVQCPLRGHVLPAASTSFSMQDTGTPCPPISWDLNSNAVHNAETIQ